MDSANFARTQAGTALASGENTRRCGARSANVLDLSWDRVNLAKRTAWIEADSFKSGEAHGVPLNDTAVEVLRDCVGKHQEYVFTYAPRRRDGQVIHQPIRQANTAAWRKALKRAGITNFRWHDLRHVAATWLAEEGASGMTMMEFFGWKSESMARRYAHLNTAHLLGPARGLDERLPKFGQT